jgi:hypothetical protein
MKGYKVQQIRMNRQPGIKVTALPDRNDVGTVAYFRSSFI